MPLPLLAAFKAKALLGKSQISSYLENNKEAMTNTTKNVSFWILLLGIILVCLFFFLYHKYKTWVETKENKK